MRSFQYAYQDATISDAQVYDAYLFSKANYENSMTLYPWVVDSFGIVNRNMIQQHMQMTTVLAEQHEALEIRLNTYMMCMTNHLGISMLQINYPDAKIDGLSRECRITLGLIDNRRLRALEEVSETAPSQAPSSSDAPTISQSLPDLFTFSVTFKDGTSITSSDPIEEEQGSDGGNEEGSGSNTTTAVSSLYMSQYEMIKRIYQTMNSTDSSINTDGSSESSGTVNITAIVQQILDSIDDSSNTPAATPSNQGQDETDTGVSTSAKWYVDWVKYTCVQDCDEDEGSRCGGKRQFGDLHPTLAMCCHLQLEWKEQNCLDHIHGTDTTRYLKENPQVEMEGLDIIKNMEEDIKDVKSEVDMIKGKVESMESKVDNIEKTMDEMKDKMDTIIEIMTQLLGQEKLVKE